MFKKIKNKKLFGVIALVGFVSLLSIGLYNRVQVESHGESNFAVAIRPIGYKIGRFEKDWELIYVVNNKPFKCYLVELDISIGDNFDMKFRKDKASRYKIGSKSNNSPLFSKILIYGDEFPESLGQKLNVFQNDSLIYSLNFNKEFAFYIDKTSSFKIEYYSKGKVKYQRNMEFKDKSMTTDVLHLNYKKNIEPFEKERLEKLKAIESLNQF